MSFVRPAARAALVRWAEPLAAAAATALGLWWALGVGGLLGVAGWGLAALGAAAALAGVQRARFRRGADGPGVVSVTEGRIAYFGPLDGGTADLETLEALSLDAAAHPAHWLLARPGEPALAIPVTAAGAERLFDVFAALPGLAPGRLLRALEGGRGTVLLWRRSGPVEASHRLH